MDEDAIREEARRAKENIKWAQRGDLVLLARLSQLRDRIYYDLGIFECMTGNEVIFERIGYGLRKPTKIPGLEHYSRVFPHYGKRYGLELLVGAWVEKNDILQYLREHDELASHIAWIASMEKPYYFPKIDTFVTEGRC